MHTARAYNGMAVTPHRLASETALRLLRKGANAVQATVAAAATLCVVYPHMTGLGGDAFWLILPRAEAEAGAPPLALDASGRSATLADHAWYAAHGCPALPKRGPLAALTMAGAVSGWEAALSAAAQWPDQDRGRELTPGDLFADAVRLAEQGLPVSASQSLMTAASLPELADQPGFAAQFLADGSPPRPGSRLCLPALARTLRRLAEEGLDSFYRGSLAGEMAEDLEAVGSPLRPADFSGHAAVLCSPLSLRFSGGTLYNTPPPTQGVSSLMILGLLERIVARTGLDSRRESNLAHAIVEATKQAFLLRDRYVADPAYMTVSPEALLAPDRLDDLAAAVSVDRALPWPQNSSATLPGGDTVWFGVMDAHGNTVSCIQSIYHEFGSGVVLPRSGVTWHNRGLGFTFAPGHANSLGPGKKPFHTLNPALAVLDDGRIVSYGTMGGEGQPQTQAAVFARALLLGRPPQEAVAAPRWLLGRAWGDSSDSLKLESDFPARVFRRLRELGHHLERLPAQSSLAGHAGLLVRHADGLLEGAFDPRSDGSAGCW